MDSQIIISNCLARINPIHPSMLEIYRQRAGDLICIAQIPVILSDKWLPAILPQALGHRLDPIEAAVAYVLPAIF